MFMLDHSPFYSDLMQRADIFLLTSRLDPLPNVAIDAMLVSKPMLCFQQACGMDYFIKKDKLLRDCLLAEYLDTSMMASKSLELIRNKDKRLEIGDLCKQNAENWFDMDNYINKIKYLGNQVSEEEKRMRQNIDTLLSNKILDKNYAFQIPTKPLKQSIYYYLLSWQNNIGTRKPFPGFHPGIYKEQVLEKKSVIDDPLIHFMNSGQPNGVWNSQLITSKSIIEPNISKQCVGLHIHIYYIELLDEILKKIQTNKIKPDLYISCPKKEFNSLILDAVEASGLVLKKLINPPNRGRDIGVLVTELGKELDLNYEYYGHIHTKKSELIEKGSANLWRSYILENLIGSEETTMIDRIITNMKIIQM